MKVMDGVEGMTGTREADPVRGLWQVLAIDIMQGC